MNTSRLFAFWVGVISTIMGLSACAALGGTTIHADYPEFSSVGELAASSTSVVLGIVGDPAYSILNGETVGDNPVLNPLAGTDQETLDSTEDTLPITVFEIDVLTCVSGGCSSTSSMKVKQLGGVVDGRTTSVEGIESLVPGETVLLFLEDYVDSPSSILGGDAGLFIERDGRFVSVGNVLLTITASDLDSISQ